MTPSELWRRVQNIVTTATVVATQAQDGKMLVQVAYEEGCVSNWIPVVGKNNSLLKVWMPPLVSEQVTVLRPLGSSDGGIVFPSIFNKGNKEPSGANEHNAIVEFSDGSRFEYDISSGTLSVTAITHINMKVPTIKLEVNELTVTGNITSNGTITDTKGDLTNHKHAVQKHSVAVPR